MPQGENVTQLFKAARPRETTVATDGGGPHDGDMTAVTREELDAKIATVEARLDGRLGRIQGLIENLATTVNDERNERRENQRSSMGTLLGLGATILVTVLGSAIGLYAAVSSDQGNLVSAFSAGQSAQTQVQVVPYPVPQIEPQAAAIGPGEPAASYKQRPIAPSTSKDDKNAPKK